MKDPIGPYRPRSSLEYQRALDDIATAQRECLKHIPDAAVWELAASAMSATVASPADTLRAMISCGGPLAKIACQGAIAAFYQVLMNRAETRELETPRKPQS